jgi:hypothetical protein
LVSPAEFIPLAEETGLIEPLGRWVLESVCAQLLAWSARPETSHFTLSMNVSAREFRRAEFVARAFEVINRTGVDPQKLMFEFTESPLPDDLDETIRQIRTTIFALEAAADGGARESILRLTQEAAGFSPVCRGRNQKSKVLNWGNVHKGRLPLCNLQLFPSRLKFALRSLSSKVDASLDARKCRTSEVPAT